MALNSFEYAQVENEIDWLKEKIESLRERAKRQPSTVREIHDLERQIKERQVKLMFDPRTTPASQLRKTKPPGFL